MLAIEATPNPVTFRPSGAPVASATAVSSAVPLASPPPPAPRFYLATVGFTLRESAGTAVNVEAITATLVEDGGRVIGFAEVDSECLSARLSPEVRSPRLSGGASFTGCLTGRAAPDVSRAHVFEVIAQGRDDSGVAVRASARLPVVFVPHP
jgi:hypothetical protein